MCQYTIHASADSDAALTFPANELHDVIERLAGRNPLAYPSVAAKFRRDGRVYIATDPNTPGRAAFGRGFVLKRQER